MSAPGGARSGRAATGPKLRKDRAAPAALFVLHRSTMSAPGGARSGRAAAGPKIAEEPRGSCRALRLASADHERAGRRAVRSRGRGPRIGISMFIETKDPRCVAAQEQRLRLLVEAEGVEAVQCL